MVYASERGAFVDPGDYTCGPGWQAVLYSSSLAYAPINYHTDQQVSLDSLKTCCIARDKSDPYRSVDPLPSPQYTTFAGVRWAYQDFGSNYYMYQCTAVSPPQCTF